MVGSNEDNSALSGVGKNTGYISVRLKSTRRVWIPGKTTFLAKQFPDKSFTCDLLSKYGEVNKVASFKVSAEFSLYESLIKLEF